MAIELKGNTEKLKIELIVEGLENFYEVWSDGPTGDVLEVAKKIADIETLSLQTAKEILRKPARLRYESSLEVALGEKKYFEKTGLKCKLVHVGPGLLNQYSKKEIESFIIDQVGSLEVANIREIKPNMVALFSDDDQVPVTYDEENFYLYLASLRYLALENKIKG